MRKLHKNPEYYKVLILRTVGNFLVLTSIFMIIKTFYLPVREEIRYFIDNTIQKKYLVFDVRNKPKKDDMEPQIPKGGLARALNLKTVEILTPEDSNFSVVIPKINANARVIPNINPADPKIYLPALQKGIAHAEGTAFPGEGGHIFLFAHSTDYFWNIGSYNAVFYLLYKLESGDQINVFYKGKRHLYNVITKTVVEPSQVEYLLRKSNKEFLTLQTCWPPGTTLKRLLIFASRVTD